MVRVKRRYILCEVSYDTSSNRIFNKRIEGQEFLNTINNSINLNFGDYGRSSAGKLSIVHLNDDSTTIMVQCKRAALKTVWASITFVTSVSAVPLSMNVIHVSGI
jgi:RNase P/RNase MRP subunit POP5